MVEYDIWPGDSSVCKAIGTKKRGVMNRMWERQVSEEAEQSVVFGIHDDGIDISNIESGDELEVDYSIKESQIERSIDACRDKYNHIGSIHTHPKQEWVMNMVMSPRDFNSHILSLDDIEGYDSSLVLTKNDGDLVIFGVVSDKQGVKTWKYQNKVSEYYDEINDPSTPMSERYMKIKEMTDTILEFSESCIYKLE